MVPIVSGGTQGLRPYHYKGEQQHREKMGGGGGAAATKVRDHALRLAFPKPLCSLLPPPFVPIRA